MRKRSIGVLRESIRAILPDAVNHLIDVRYSQRLREVIERVTGLSEGNIYAGEFLAPQMYFFRPAPGWSQYRTPIEGYYQCGSGTHPGGCVIGAPGRLASQQVLKDVRGPRS